MRVFAVFILLGNIVIICSLLSIDKDELFNLADLEDILLSSEFCSFNYVVIVIMLLFVQLNRLVCWNPVRCLQNKGVKTHWTFRIIFGLEFFQ